MRLIEMILLFILTAWVVMPVCWCILTHIKSLKKPPAAEPRELDPIEEDLWNLRPWWWKGSPSNDWWEDRGLENGNYFNKCVSCRADFVGHKRRVVCRKCHKRAEEEYAALTPDQQRRLRLEQVAVVESYYDEQRKLQHNHHEKPPGNRT